MAYKKDLGKNLYWSKSIVKLKNIKDIYKELATKEVEDIVTIHDDITKIIKSMSPYGCSFYISSYDIDKEKCSIAYTGCYPDDKRKRYTEYYTIYDFMIDTEVIPGYREVDSCKLCIYFKEKSEVCDCHNKYCDIDMICDSYIYKQKRLEKEHKE